MNRSTFFFILVSVLLTFHLLQAESFEKGYYPGEIIVKFHDQITPVSGNDGPTTGIASVDEILDTQAFLAVARALPAVEEGNAFGLDRVWSLKFADETDLDPLIAALNADPAVAYAEPRYVRTVSRRQSVAAPPVVDGADEIPNDPSYSLQWGLTKVSAANAWDYTHGSADIPIAIVDSGTDLDHPDLQDDIWENTEELLGLPGVDDDENGYIDDFYGWDFMDNDGYPDPDPGSSHGSHCSGIASAVTDNGVGIAGLGWNCPIMSVRAGTGLYIYYGTEGINYAALTGARVISCSWGGPTGSQYEQDVINDATARGALVVAAAGNESSSAPHFPSAFDNVLAVAATNPGDVRSSYSNFGEWVDCAAPGDQIYSTVIGGYGYMSGTSMACPLVAGLAGLVTSMHPEWEPDRVEAQILSTCDNIDALNPGFAGLLGAGRINAERAVTESNPYLIISDEGYQDEDGDGVIEPGEGVDFWVEVTNLLEPLNNVQGTVSTDDPYATLTQTQADFGDLGSGASASNQSAPFSFMVSPSAPGSHQITFTLEITGDGGYSSTHYVRFTVLPIYGNHDVGNVVLTVTNFGSLGYYDYAGTGTNVGSGFQYPAGTTSGLFHGSLMVGISPNQVSDNCYGNNAYDNYDFTVIPGGELFIQQGTVADQEGLAIFDDGGSSAPLGVEITQRSYAWADPPDDDYVILRFDVSNPTTSTLSGVYVSLYLDWDINDYSANSAGWDPDSLVGYMFDESSPLYGLCLLSHDPVSYRAVENAVYVYNNAYTDAIKYQFMTEGFITTQSASPGDYSMQMTAGPFDLDPGGTESVAFAMLGGDGVRDLQQNVGAARQRWLELILPVTEAPENSSPTEFILQPAFPNPFNPVTAIRFLMPEAGWVTLDVFDVNGRMVGRNSVTGFARSASAKWYPAGTHRIVFDGSGLSSGIYLYRLTVNGYSAVGKMVLMK